MRSSWLFLLILALVACSKNSSDDRTPLPKERTQPPPAEFVGEGSIADEVKEAVGLGPSIPDLKPIAKGPFPDGATQEQVCEAIEDADQKDLWVRFGHLVPLYEPSTVFVLAVHGQTAEDIFDYVMRKYKGGGRYGPMVKVCKKLDKALLYVRYMFDDAVLNGLLTGRQDLAKHMKEALGVETLESYFFEARQNAKRDRLAEYCRKDAYVCEELLRLLQGNGAKGLCRQAVSYVGIDPFDKEHAKLVTKCRAIKRPPFACTEYAREGAEQRACLGAIRNELNIRLKD